jgi:uncharacterized protein YrrD
MSAGRKLDVLKDLKEMAIINSNTGEKLGIVQDALVNPTQGRLLGLLYRDSGGQTYALSIQNILIGRDAVMTGKDFRPETEGQSEMLHDGIATEQLKGANVVTGDGRLLGRISAVYVSADQPNIAYHVTESALQRFFGGGFYLAGEVPHAYAPDGVRLIVPEETDHRFAVATLDEAFGASAAA